jgi:membrane carboxypeptidase/penicillin-binding protein
METLPPIQAAVDYQPPTTTQIFAADGSLIGEFTRRSATGAARSHSGVRAAGVHLGRG